MRFEIVQGDLEPDLDFEVFEDVTEEELENLSDCTAFALRVELPDGTRQIWAVAPLDAATGRMRHVWLAGQTEQAGQYKAQLVATRGNGEPQTFPSDGHYIRWRVNPRLT